MRNVTRCDATGAGARRPARRAGFWRAPRELPPDLEQWRPHAWSVKGRNHLHSGHICPACAAIEDDAHAEGLRSALRTINQHVDDYITRARLSRAA